MNAKSGARRDKSIGAAYAGTPPASMIVPATAAHSRSVVIDHCARLREANVSSGALPIPQSPKRRTVRKLFLVKLGVMLSVRELTKSSARCAVARQGIECSAYMQIYVCVLDSAVAKSRDYLLVNAYVVSIMIGAARSQLISSRNRLAAEGRSLPTGFGAMRFYDPDTCRAVLTSGST